MDDKYIPCKHEHWVIVDDEWNHDFVCDLPEYKYCGFHGNCPNYEPKYVNCNEWVLNSKITPKEDSILDKLDKEINGDERGAM